MGQSPRIVYLYNAASGTDRELLSVMEQYGQCHCDLQLIKADVYKSNGIAQRLNVTETPCVAYIRDNQLVGCVNCGNISPTAIDTLVKR